MDQLHSFLGVAAICLLAWLLSEQRRAVPWRTVAGGLLLQAALAVLLLKLPGMKAVFASVNDAVGVLDTAARSGTRFVFGFLGGGPPPFAETQPGASYVLAFQALPLVLVVGALTALLYHWRVLPVVVQGFSWLLRRTMGVGGAVGLSSAANVFVGMVEAPMVVRPYLATMARGELFIVMTAGMASIAGTVFALYAVFLGPVVPDAAGHLLVASIISAPAAITVSALMVPAGLRGADAGGPGAGDTPLISGASSSMDALVQGTADAVNLLINIVAMLLVLVALVSLLNLIVEAWLPAVAGAPLTLQRLLGWVMAPLAWLIGIPWAEAPAAGALLGTKTVLNEFLAYLDLSRMPSGVLSERSRIMMTYALCGFANLGSLGIMVGGLNAMCPQRRAEIVELGSRSLISGTLAACMTAAWVGVLLG